MNDQLNSLDRLERSHYQTLLELVEHYSPSGAEKEAVDHLVSRMQVLGYDTAFSDEVGNAVGVMGSGPRQIVLLGHIDTVPGEIPVRVEGDLLYGRGSVDAKGPLAAFVDAVAAAVANVGNLPGWQFVVIGAVDEERESIGARYIVDRYSPDFAIIGEPSRWHRITLGYKGIAWSEIVVNRPMAHSARPSDSACESAVKVWNSIQGWTMEFNAGRTRIFDQVIPTLRGMTSAENGFKEWANMRVGVRLPADLSPESWYSVLDEIIETQRSSDPIRITQEPTGFPIRAYKAKKNTPLVCAFLSSIRASSGKPGFVLKSGTADLNIVAPVWECPAVAYGPGDSTLDHTPSEHISLAEYQQAVTVLEKVLHKITR